MTTEQLSRIGDLRTPLALRPSSESPSPLSRLQHAALSFADQSTAHVSLANQVFEELKSALKERGAEEQVLNQKLVEAAATVATYNMASRFLVATAVDDKANAALPVPSSSSEQTISTPSADGSFPLPHDASSHSALYYAPDAGYIQSSSLPGGLSLATRVHFHSYTAPWLLLINSLMTNLSMWDWILPSLKSRYNIITYDQAGHGLSSVPSDSEKGCTIHSLADDAAMIVTALGVPRLHAVIGVSQGGATALSFGIRHGEMVEKVVACDTQAFTPAANVKAWDERIASAREEGNMQRLGQVTVDRWFDAEKSMATDSVRRKVGDMIDSTKVEGFVAGARALQGYDLPKDGLVEKLGGGKKQVLLIAGEADGALPQGLEKLAGELGGGPHARFAAVQKAGHLPMCDNPQGFLKALLPFLEGSK